MKKCVITSAARTPIGAFLGGLKEVPVEELAAITIKKAIELSGIEPDQVEDVIMGHVISSTDAPNLARDAALLCGMEKTPGTTVNRICGSGLQAVANAIMMVQTSQADIVVAGGAESLSRAPYYLPLSVRYAGFRNLSKTLKCANEMSHFNAAPNSIYPPVWMGNTAENIVEKYNISREEQDLFAYESQMKTKKAIELGKFDREIVPVEITTRKGKIVIDKDEHPKPEVTLERLAQLKPAFKKDGSVTAGNATGLNDGAASLVIMSEDRCKELSLKPMAYLVDFAIAALDPMYMGLGPAYAIPKLLEKNNLKYEDIDLYEINEAFAGQVLGCLRKMEISRDSELYKRINVNGGAVALGHPLGMSGARIIGSLAHELSNSNAKYGVASACIGGGMGIAVLLENAYVNGHI